MLGIPGKGALQNIKTVSVCGPTASTGLGNADHTVYVRKFGQNLCCKSIGNVTADRSGTGYAGQNPDVVSGRHLTVIAYDAIERGLLFL